MTLAVSIAFLTGSLVGGICTSAGHVATDRAVTVIAWPPGFPVNGASGSAAVTVTGRSFRTYSGHAELGLPGAASAVRPGARIPPSPMRLSRKISEGQC